MSTSTVSLPPKLPVLAARHIARDWFSRPDGTRCLLGWRQRCAPKGIEEISPVEVALAKIVAEKTNGVSDHIPEFNDNRSNSRSTVASVWNRAAKSLGYTKSPSGRWWILPKKRGAANAH